MFVNKLNLKDFVGHLTTKDIKFAHELEEK